MKGQHTDLDEIRMAAAYRRRRMTGPATFSLFVWPLPARREFWSPPAWPMR
jgi:nicotinate phosphoribosyltransferase